MRNAPQPVRQTHQEAGGARPIETGRPGTEVEAQTLLEFALKLKTQEPLVVRKYEEASMRLGNVEDERYELLTSV